MTLVRTGRRRLPRTTRQTRGFYNGIVSFARRGRPRVPDCRHLWPVAPLLAGLLLASCTTSPGIVSRTAPISLQIRPALCYAPTYSPDGRVAGARSGRPPACTSAALLDVSNLRVNPMPNTVSGYAVRPVWPDWGLASYRSTTGKQVVDGRTVLLNATSRSVATEPVSGMSVRFVLGQVLLTRAGVASAHATKDASGQWSVLLTLTSAGSRAWDAATMRYFHRYLAVVIDGRVASVPLVQPTQSVWTSFSGQVEISDYWSERKASEVAAGL
jgi:hypothetical protein